ncbi:MAG: NUDIX hydrolase [Patescibacteria group bacterium]
MSITLQVGVKALLKNKDDKYLLLNRSREKYPTIKGHWDIPGGRIEPGTSLLENLKREVKEEAGLSVVGEPKLIHATDILRVPGLHVVRLTYVGNVTGKIKLDPLEIVEYEWVTLEEMKDHTDLDMYTKELFYKNIISSSLDRA